LYVIFTNEGQFVIVSAEDNATPVLGYSSDVRPIPQTWSPEFIWWIQQYSDQIQDIVDNNIELPENQVLWNEYLSGTFSFNTRNERSVSPLVSTLWDQGVPYNELCPGAPAVPTGCVATALAQVMKYWSHPITGVGSNSYYDISNPGENPSYGYQSANFGATTYLWDQMPNIAASSNIPLATIMRHAGVAVNMNYDTSGSGAFSEVVAPALQNYFRYPNALYRSRASFSEANWIIMMKAQMDEGSPVYYAGQSPDGGHAFVMDGYDAADMFHFNLGWGGSSNGYYLVSAINGSGGFNTSQAAVINTTPQNYNLSAAKLTMKAASGATVGTPLNLAVTTPPILGSWNVNHYEFVLTYENSFMSYTGASITGTMAANGTVNITELEPGFLSVNWNSTANLLGPGTLINFTFVPNDAGDYLFDMADMKFNTSPLAQTEYIYVPVAAPVTALAQSGISMTNVMNLTYNSIGTTDLRTTYLLPSWNVNLYQFNLTYVPTKLEFVGLETVGTLSAGLNPVAVQNSPGSITVTCNTTTRITGEGALLKLLFRAIGNTSSLSITQVTPSNFVYNTTPISTISGCTFRLSAYSSNDDDLAVPSPAFSVYPNPFSSATAFKFSSSSNAPATFNVYNLKGQMVRQMVASEGKATELVWNGKDENGNNVAGGIYLVRWQQGTNGGSAKVLILK
jgi:hypothetical protein